MTTVAQGTSVTLNLSPNDAVTVTGAANTEGTVTVSRAGQAFVNPQVALSAVTFKYGPPASSKTYGPYDVGATVVIAATAGDVTYTLLSTGLNPSASASALLAQTNLAYPFPLPKWRKALADVLAGVADARVAFAGDSTTVGLLTGTGGLWARSASVVMGKLLAARGIPVNMNNCWGDQTRTGGTTYTNFDPRCALGSNWSSAGGGINLVGGSPIGNTAGSGTFSFTPLDPVTGAAYQFDTIDVYYCQNTSYGSFQIAVDGGAAIGGTVVCNGARMLQVASRSVTLGAHTVNINATAAGQIFLIGIVCSNSAQKAVRIFNMGGGSLVSGNFTMGTIGDFTPTPAMTNNTLTPVLAPHLCIIDLGVNDRRLALYNNSYDSALQSMITRLQTVGSDVILCKPMPSDLTTSAFTTQANQDAFDAAVDRLVIANGLPPAFSKRARFQSYEIGNPNGFYSDGLHCSYAGYTAQGMDLAALLAL
jgi:hypothetical protein